MITEEQIRTALDAEFPHAEPPLTLWERVKPAIPGRAPRRRPSRLAVAAVWSAAVLTAGAAAAATPQVQTLIDRYFQKTGITLHDATPLPPHTPEPQKEVAPSDLRSFVPAGMKLPTYLPAPLDGPNTRATISDAPAGTNVLWHTTGGKETPYLGLTRHASVANGEGTFGPVEQVQEIRIGDVNTSAYQDNSGWHIVWLVDGSQYMLQASNLPLHEAVKVAESLK